MGADLLLVTASAPYVTPSVRKRIEKLCDELDFHPDSLLSVWHHVGIERANALEFDAASLRDLQTDYEMIGVDDDEPPTVDEWVRSQLREAVDKIVGPYRRDVTTIARGQREDYITGGMSWGDNPTDAFAYIEWLGSFDLYGRAIAYGEASRAVLNLSMEAQS